MTEPRWAPGPWEFRDANFGRRIHAADNDYIGAVAMSPNGSMLANAHLIAAAPDLYAALAQGRRYVELAYECAFPDESENERVLAEIDAALAKARGEGEKP